MIFEIIMAQGCKMIKCGTSLKMLVCHWLISNYCEELTNRNEADGVFWTGLKILQPDKAHGCKMMKMLLCDWSISNFCEELTNRNEAGDVFWTGLKNEVLQPDNVVSIPFNVLKCVNRRVCDNYNIVYKLFKSLVFC
jgi:hypothetical protein